MKMQEYKAAYLILLIQMYPLSQQITYQLVMALSSCPVDGAVTSVVNHTQVATLGSQHLEDVQLTQSSCHMDGTLSMLVGLVNINVGHGQELVQTFQIVFLDGAKNGRKYKVIILKNEK